MRPDRAYYISGPMTGMPEFNFPAFKNCAERLRAQGCTVFSPHEKGTEGEAGDAAWNRYLREDIQMMTAHCNALVLLDGWPRSRGARLELSIALALDFKIFYWRHERLEDA